MKKNLLSEMKSLFVTAMLLMVSQATFAADYTKEFFFKVTATAQPTGAGTVYVSVDTTEPSADKYAETSEDTGVAEAGYDEGDPEPEWAYGERELWAMPKPGFQFAGWSTTEAPNEIISTSKHYTADFTVTGTDKENRQVFSFIANFKESGAIEDGEYYIRDVVSGKYISQGQQNGTHATLDGDGLAFTLIYDVQSKTYAIKSALGYLGKNEYVDAQESDKGQWAISLADGIFTISEGGKNLCVDGVNVYLASAAAAKWELVPVATRTTMTGTFAKPADATYMILHPCFEANKGAWVAEGETNLGELDQQRSGDFTPQSKNSAKFSVMQTIEGLKAGIYRLTFNGYYRYNVEGGVDDNTAAIVAHADGTEVINAYVEANAVSAELKSIADEASITLAGGAAPVSVAESQAAFAKGAYLNEIYCVVEGDGVLTIAFKKDEQAFCDLTMFDNLNLEYLGAFPKITSPSEKELTEDEMKAGVMTAVFSIAGTGISVDNEANIEVKLGVSDEDGWWSYDTAVEGANVTYSVEPREDGTTKLTVNCVYDKATYGERYRIFIQQNALSCYGLLNSSRGQATFIMPNESAGINEVSVDNSVVNGKFLNGNNIVIVKSGKKYSVIGTPVK